MMEDGEKHLEMMLKISLIQKGNRRAILLLLTVNDNE